MIGMRGIVLLAGGSGGSYGSGGIDNFRADTIATAVPRTQESPEAGFSGFNGHLVQ